MRFALLGPVELITGAGSVPAGSPRSQAFLAYLLLNAKRVLSRDELVAALWGPAEPSSASAQIHVVVSTVRRLLRQQGFGEIIVTRAGGYRAMLRAGDVDVDVFAARVATARSAAERGDWREATALLRAGLGLWRGVALSGLTAPYAATAREHLAGTRLAAWELLADAELALGRHVELVPELAAILDESPGRERMARQLMLAQYRAGLPAAALQTARAVRRHLVEEQGLDPTEQFAVLERAILNADPMLDLTPPTPTGSTPATSVATSPASTDSDSSSTATAMPDPRSRVLPPMPVPAQLPAQVVGFVGRGPELIHLDALLRGDGPAGAAVVISAVSGMAGVGKTALALHWAHRVAPRFPDGQLYVNLRGFGPEERTAAPADVLRSLLGALGVAPDRLPHDLDGRAGLFRSLLAGKRILLVLDNARDSDQVRPLLPGTATALTVVTSRNPLTGLVVEVGAHPLTLDVLPAVDARELLARRLGSDRIDAEPEAADAIIAACARLPLALAIAAAHAQRTGFRLSAFAAELAPTDRRLGALDTGEAGGQIRAVFSWSYATLTSAAAQVFRHLGLHVGDDISTAAAASLAGIPADRARELLAELVHANLVTEHIPGRFACHDLIRAYAAEMSGRIEAAAQRHMAVHRVLDHYLHTAHTADTLLNPRRDRITVAPPQPGVTPEELSGYDQAMAWFSTEHQVLLSAIDRAAASGFDVHTWQLARTVSTYLHRRGHWHDRATTQHLAVAATRKLGDAAAEARAHLILGDAYTSLIHFSDAFMHFKLALDLYEGAGDGVGRAHTLHTIAHLWERQDNHTEALRYASLALDLYRATGYRVGQAAALNEVGWHHTSLGDHHLALASCQQALALFEELDDPAGQAATWDSLGYAYRRSGQHSQAARCYQRAVDLHRGLGDRYEEADTLANLGDVQRDAGDTAAAREAWQRAIDILTELDHPDAARIRDKLDRVTRRHADGQTAHRHN